MDDKARYETLKKELLAALPKKRAVDKQLATLETQLYQLEANYLSETSAQSGGNVIQGFENYMKTQGVGRRKIEPSDQDRIFSNSSTTTHKSLDLTGEGDETGGDDFSKQTTPGVTTVTLPPATRNQELTVAQQNKLTRDKEYQRRKRANASNRRSTGTISDDEVIPQSTTRRPNKRARHTDDD